MYVVTEKVYSSMILTKTSFCFSNLTLPYLSNPVHYSLQVWTRRGLLLTDPVERGLRVVEITLLTEPLQPEVQVILMYLTKNTKNEIFMGVRWQLWGKQI